MTRIKFTHKDADSLRRTVVQLTATLKGIELQLQRIADSSDNLSSISNSLEAFMGPWQIAEQPNGSFQEFLEHCKKKD